MSVCVSMSVFVSMSVSVSVSVRGVHEWLPKAPRREGVCVGERV